MRERIVLAYSGDLETSVATRWLADTSEAEIVAVVLDVGQREELDGVRERALAAGAARCHVLDVREELARDYVLPALQANALSRERYPMAAWLAQPLVAAKLVEVARIERATAVAHGGSGRDAEHSRIERCTRALEPRLRIVAPARHWSLTPAQQAAYAQERGIPVAVPDHACSVDANLWGRSVDCGPIADAWLEPPETLYRVTRSPAEAPDQPALVEISFARGVPVAVNGVPMPITELVDSLTTIASGHGVGRLDTIDAGRSGAARRQIHEAPAAVVLHVAHEALESFVTLADLQRFAHQAAVQYAEVVDAGLWFSPLREALDAFVEKVQARVTGVVRLKLFKGGCRVMGRQSEFALPDGASGEGETSNRVPVAHGR